VSSQPQCGAITYEVIDMSTGLPLDIRFKEFSLNQTPARLLLLAEDKARIELLTEIVIRASQSNIASVDSTEFAFGCIDPCL